MPKSAVMGPAVGLQGAGAEVVTRVPEHRVHVVAVRFGVVQLGQEAGALEAIIVRTVDGHLSGPGEVQRSQSLLLQGGQPGASQLLG